MPLGSITKCLLLAAALGVGCSRRPKVAMPSERKKAVQAYPSQWEVGTVFRYAFSGQVRDSWERPLEKFSVEIVAEDPSLSVIINGGGGSNGLFHISRNHTSSGEMFRSLPLLISAKGFIPLLSMVDLGSDPKRYSSPGNAPTPFTLSPIILPEHHSDPRAGKSFFSLDSTREIADVKGIPSVFSQLIHFGKLDRSIEVVLTRSRNKDLVQNVLVVLAPLPRSETESVFKGLLGSVLIPLGDEGSSFPPSYLFPLASVRPLLAYAKNGIGENDTSKRNLLALLGKVMGNQEELAKLEALLSSEAEKAVTTYPFHLASMGLGFSHTAIAKNSGSVRPIETALLTSLGESVPQRRGRDSTRDRVPKYFVYLLPLVQGLLGKNSPEITKLFNQMVERINALDFIRDLSTVPHAQEVYARILPYIEPLIRGLNGPDGNELRSFLRPLLLKKNPARQVRNLLEKGNHQDTHQWFSIISVFYPSIQHIIDSYVPAKQLLAAQIIHGIYYEDIKEVTVVRDLPGASAVILSGQARDIFKIAQLPNVEKVYALDELTK